MFFIAQRHALYGANVSLLRNGMLFMAQRHAFYGATACFLWRNGMLFMAQRHAFYGATPCFLWRLISSLETSVANLQRITEGTYWD